MIGDREALYYPWTFYEYAVCRRWRDRFSSLSKRTLDAMEARPIGFVVVEFDRAFLEQQYLPEMVSRHFGALALENFGVTVRSAGLLMRRSTFRRRRFRFPGRPLDVKLDLFDSVADEARQRGHAPLQPSSEGQQWQWRCSIRRVRSKWALRIGGGEAWRLALGCWGCWSACTVLVVSVARRAERLGEDADGVCGRGIARAVHAPGGDQFGGGEPGGWGGGRPAQMRQYGGMIRDQGRRLERLVDEVLLFAAGNRSRRIRSAAGGDWSSCSAES